MPRGLNLHLGLNVARDKAAHGVGRIDGIHRLQHFRRHERLVARGLRILGRQFFPHRRARLRILPAVRMRLNSRLLVRPLWRYDAREELPEQ